MFVIIIFLAFLKVVLHVYNIVFLFDYEQKQQHPSPSIPLICTLRSLSTKYIYINNACVCIKMKENIV